MCLHPRGTVRRVPAYVSFLLSHLSRSVARDRHYSCAVELRPSSSSPRVDAQASSTRTGVAGWLPYIDSNGAPDTSRSPWFSHEIKAEDKPWVFEKGDRPSLIIATLEAPAVLLSLELLQGEIPPTHRTKIMVTPAWTDNRGNGAALNKLMTTSCPASAVLMELAAHMKRMLLKIQIGWSPRTGNNEADALANGVFDGFDVALRVPLDPHLLSWELLPQALETGRAAELEHRSANMNGLLPNRGKRQRKRKLDERLKITDPW